MKDRILALINFYGITRTEFAQRIGVTKGAVSHIVSANGRGGELKEANIERILKAFPEVNRTWLVGGSGQMLVGSQPTSELAAAPVQQSIFAAADQQQTAASAPQQSQSVEQVASKPQKKTYQNSGAQASEHKSFASAAQQQSEPYVCKEPSAPYYIAYNPQQQPVIERIVIFYTDGTFTQHRPRMTSENE